jgi:hypothetical protein
VGASNAVGEVLCLRSKMIDWSIKLGLVVITV